MYTRTRRKKRTESMEATTGERDVDEEDDDNDNQLLRRRQFHHQRDLSPTTNPVTPASISSLAGKFSKLIYFQEQKRH